MRFILPVLLLGMSVSAFAKKDTLKARSCAVRASFLESKINDKLLSQRYELSGSSKLSSSVAYSGSSDSCPTLEKSNDSSGLVVIGMLVNQENIKVPLTTMEALLSQNCDEPIEVQSLAKLCIYEISSDGSSKLIFDKKKEFAANIFRVDSEVKEAARKWLAKQVPECEEI